MYNPRFPYSFVAYRAKTDANGDPVTDAEGQPTYERIKFTKAVMYDYEAQFNSDGTMVTEEVDTMPFGYRTSSENTRKYGDVALADYRLACPIFLTSLEYGDVLYLTDRVRTYKCEVVKQTTFNLGTNVWVNEVKN